MKNLGSLFAAYIAVWVIFFLYQVSLGLRLSGLRTELERLKQQWKSKS